MSRHSTVVIAVVAVLVAALAAGCSGSGTSRGVTGGVEPTLPVAGADTARHGDVAFIIEKIEVGKLRLLNGITKEKRPEGKHALTIHVRAKNTSTDVLLLLNWWGAGFGSPKPFATLVDGKGNEYQQVLVSGGDWIVGADNRNRFRPGESGVDVLAFEEPLATARDLLLTIGVPKHGEHPEGKVAFRIPAAMWKPAK